MFSFLFWSYLFLLATPQSLIQHEIIKLQKQSPMMKVIMTDTQELSLISNLHLQIQGTSVEDKTQFFLQSYAGLFPTMVQFKIQETLSTKNRKVVDLVPMIDQKPIFNQSLKLSFNQNQELIHLSTNLSRFQKITQATLTQEQALKKVQQALSIANLKPVVKEGYLIQQDEAKLVYQFSIPHLDFAQQKVAYVDGTTGEISFVQQRVWR